MKAIDSNVLREKFLKQADDKANKGKGAKKDLRFLNYYDLKYGETITIRLLPDAESEELWLDYSTHGSNLKNRAIKPISCVWDMQGESCPACGHSYSFHEQGDKKEAARWRSKESSVGQCVVVDSPIEIAQAEDGNLVKLIHIPYGIREYIKECVINQTVPDPTAVNLVIKKTENAGKQATYNKTYFNINDDAFPEEVLSSFEVDESYLYDLSKELPPSSTAAEVQTWLDAAIVTDRGGNMPQDPAEQSTVDRNEPPVPSSNGNEEAPPVETPASGKTGASDLLMKLKRSRSAT